MLAVRQRARALARNAPMLGASVAYARLIYNGLVHFLRNAVARHTVTCVRDILGVSVRASASGSSA